MAKKTWFKAAGLVLLCHLTITSCQKVQETSEPKQPTTNSLTSTSQSQTEKTKAQTGTETAADKKEEKTKTESKDKVIPGVTVPTSDGFILTDESKILSHTKDGIVVEHDGHSHFIFYADLKDTKFAHLIPTGADLTKPTPAPQAAQAETPRQQATGDDHHYTFNPADIVAEDALGYTVRHGDHYHYILKSSLTAQPGTSSTVAATPTLPSTGFAGNGRADQPVPPVQTGRQETRPSSQAIAGIDYPTSDGFLFDGTGIQGWTDLGLIVDHGGHLHIILKTDLAKSKWAHLLSSQAAPAVPVVTAQPALPAQPNKPNGSEVPAQPTSPVQPETPVVPTVPQVDDLATKRAYLAQATGLAEDQIILLDTPSGPAFMYPHGDHSHLVLLSSLDVTKPFDDGHGGHDHGDDHAHDEGDDHDGHHHDTDDHGHEEATEPSTSEPSDPTSPTAPVQPEIPVAPTKPVQPETPATPTAPQVDDLAAKRAYLAQATGLTEDQIILLDTPSGPAFMYPHGDHSHLVLLSSLDVTKPFDDGHGTPDHNHDDHAHPESGDHDGHHHDTDDHGHEETTVPETPTVSEPSDPAQPAQPSEPETPDVPAQPTEQIQPEAPAEPTNPVEPETPESSTPAAEVSTPVEPPATVAVEIPTVSEPTEHDGVVNPNVPSDSNETQPADSEETAVVSPVTQPEVPTIPEVPVTGNQETIPELPVVEQPAEVEAPVQPTEPVAPDQTGEAGETTAPAIPEQPTEGVVSTPPVAPQIDEVAVKRAYLAAATGLSEDQILLLNTPAGPSFMYPHGDHHHVILISQLDVTKPFDDGHGNQGKDGEADQGHQADDHHAHDDNSPQDGHHHDNDGPDEGITEPARTQDSEPETPEVPSEPTATGEVEEATGTESSEEANQPVVPVQPEQPVAPVQKGFAGIDYPTSDGFLFDGTGMAGWTSAGLLVDHGGHTHILPTEAIAKSKWAYLLPKETADTSTAPVELSEHLAKQRENLAKQFGLNPEDIRVVTADGKVVGFEYPHEDHYDFVPISDGENPSGLTDEDKRELTAYIRKTYGLLLGTPVTYHEGFVVFAIPHPHQDYNPKRDYYSDVLDPAYDPGHVHPYAVPLSHLSVLKPTGILELDFENELIAAAKRIGVAPSEVKIKDKKYFVLPGKDHDHYLNILTPIAGYDAYMANKLPDIKADFAVGSYSKAEVVAEADRILAAAEEQFGPGTVEFRRVARALEAFKVNLTVATTSTDGYLKALQSFENKHLKGLVEEEAEATAVDPLVATYLDLSERLKGYDERTLKQYALNAEQLINKLKIMVALKDEAGLERVATHFAAIDRAKKASSDLAPRLAYMDFFLKNLDSNKLPASLRQEVIDKLIELQKISGLYRNPQKFREGLEDTALLKAKVKAALAATSPAPDHANWTPYPRGFDRKEMANTVNSMRDFLIKNKEMTAEEMADGFGKKLDLFPVHPKKPTTPVVVPPAQPKPVEEVTKPAEPNQPEASQPTPDKDEEKPAPEQPTDSNQTQPENSGTETSDDNAETVTQPAQPEGPAPQPTDGAGESTTPVDQPVDLTEEAVAGEGDGADSDDFDWSGWKPIFDIPVDGDDSSRDPEGAEETDWPVWKPIFEVPEDTDFPVWRPIFELPEETGDGEATGEGTDVFDLPIWKPIVALPEDVGTNPVDGLAQPTPEVDGQPGGTEEGNPTPADPLSDEGAAEPATSSGDSQPSVGDGSVEPPHEETVQPVQPEDSEEEVSSPAEANTPAVVTEQPTEEVVSTQPESGTSAMEPSEPLVSGERDGSERPQLEEDTAIRQPEETTKPQVETGDQSGTASELAEVNPKDHTETVPAEEEYDFPTWGGSIFTLPEGVDSPFDGWGDGFPPFDRESGTSDGLPVWRPIFGGWFDDETQPVEP